MLELINEFKSRNASLFYFGLMCFLFSLFCLVMSKISAVQVYQVNAWYKPFKFAASTFLFSWSMLWYCHYLHDFSIRTFNWVVILCLGFEIVYIAWQASRGQASHYNSTTPFYAAMFSLMAIAATIVTCFVAYVAFLFCTQSFPELLPNYLWAIRFGLIIFVIFSFEGFVMGSKLSHTVGAINDNSNWWILGWSKSFGDLRIAHFVGMHALQVLPLLSYYLLKNTKWTILAAAFYLLIAVTTFIQAIQGKPLWSSKVEKLEQAPPTIGQNEHANAPKKRYETK
jgi:hypothetical protein